MCTEFVKWLLNENKKSKQALIFKHLFAFSVITLLTCAYRNLLRDEMTLKVPNKYDTT